MKGPVEAAGNSIIIPAGVFPGWQWIQDTPAINCGTGVSTCSVGTNPVQTATVAGSVWVMQVITGNDVDISSITGGSGCTWTRPSASHIYNATKGLALSDAYCIGGNAGATSFTVTMTGNVTSNFFPFFWEFLPPKGSTASLDTSSSSTHAACTSCTTDSMTLTSTDIAMHFFGSGFAPFNDTTWHPAADPWIYDGNGLVALDVTNATGGGAISYTQDSSSPTVNLGIAFKSSAGNYAILPKPFSIVHLTWTSNSNTNCNVSGTCTVTIPSATNGNLFFIWAATTVGKPLLSVTGGGTWTIPAGCQVNLSSNTQTSCAYSTNVPNATTSLSLKCDASSCTLGYEIWELARNDSGTWTLDQIATKSLAAQTNPPGINFCASGCDAPALTSNTEVIFQALSQQGGIVACTYYPQPFSGDQACGYMYSINETGVVLLNTNNSNPPVYITNSNLVSAEAAVTWK